MRPIQYMRRILGLSVLVAVVVSLSGVATLAAQTQTPPAAQATPDPAASPAPAAKETKPAAKQAAPLPVDVDHIKAQAEKQPAVKLDEQQLKFYVLILAKAPTFNDFIGDYDLKNGPTRGGAAMSHQEFLNIVTPKALNELFGSTSGSSFAMLQAAVMNAAGQSLLSKAIQDMRKAHDEREAQAIRERINQELAALLDKDQ